MKEVHNEERRVSKRVRNAILIRFEVLKPYKEAERRAVGYLLSSGAAGTFGRVMARSLNMIWAVADNGEAQGIMWMTRRVSLAGIYIPAFLSWLGNSSSVTVERIVDSGLVRTRCIGNLKKEFSSRQKCMQRE